MTFGEPPGWRERRELVTGIWLDLILRRRYTSLVTYEIINTLMEEESTSDQFASS